MVAEIQHRFSVADALDSTAEEAASQAGAVRQAVLKRAFEGGLVGQCEDDGSAEKLLERIRSSRSQGAT